MKFILLSSFRLVSRESFSRAIPIYRRARTANTLASGGPLASTAHEPIAFQRNMQRPRDEFVAPAVQTTHSTVAD
jgi:hypothetical protein